MSLNPLISTITHEPIRFENEFFIIKRNNVEYEITPDNMSPFTGKGIFILTSMRFLIVPIDNSNITIHSFEFPLTNISEEAYNQPFIGQSYLSGICFPIFGSSLGKVSFNIWFGSESCSTIIPILFNVVDSIRANKNKEIEDRLVQLMKNKAMCSIFPINPEDPSIFYTNQPEEVIPIQKQMFQSVMINNNMRPNMMISQPNNQNVNDNIYKGNNNIMNNTMFINPYRNNNINNNNIQNQINNTVNIVPEKENEEELSNPYVPKNEQRQNRSVIPKNTIQSTNISIQNVNPYNTVIDNNKIYPLFPDNSIKKEQSINVPNRYPSLEEEDNPSVDYSNNNPHRNPLLNNNSYYK